MRSSRKYVAVAAAAAAALALAACGSSGSSSGGNSASGKITLTWWSNANANPLLGVFGKLMKEYHASHPNVSFSYVPIQNESYDTKIQVALQGNNPPDIFFQRGGGYMATQLKSGKLENLTPYVSSWISELGAEAAAWQINGGQYGIPYDLHSVGFWYRKDLFAKAGITSPPATMPELDSDITKLKAAHIVPIAVGSKDQWPDAFYYDYFAVRECSIPTLKSAIKTVSASNPCFLKAGNDVKAFMATNPFQPAFLNTPAQVGAGSSAGMVASGKAAMELQGDWDPSVMEALVPKSQWNADINDIGWFPFPAVPGAPGNSQALLGGGDGNSCSTGAPEPACADFLEYLETASAQKLLVATADVGLPANPAASSALTLPAEQTILAATKQTPYIQEYFDLAWPTNVGSALDAAVANMFANKATPQDIVSAINQAAAQQ
ncbi:MAG TPA: extracellular solute-binding protein [Streptosporangiaceae bacterium]|nr:extracellular solute-binding protein [Streptosporangiaceae bacterium]